MKKIMPLEEARAHNKEVRQGIFVLFLTVQGLFWIALAMERVTRDGYEDWPNLLAWAVMWLCLAVAFALPIIYMVRKASTKSR